MANNTPEPQPIKAYMRSKQIFTLLRENGPLSSRAIRRMIEPEMKPLRLYDSLRRLVKRGLIVKRNEGIFRNAGVFYQLSQNPIMRERIAQFLGCSASDIHQPQFHLRELLHAESCAFWAHYLRKAFPLATVVRDYEYRSNDTAKNALPCHYNLGESALAVSPDLLLIFKDEAANRNTIVAFEIERTRKTILRLATKLKRYAAGSQVDGVVYVCATDTIAQLVASTYRSRIMSKPSIICRYPRNFLVFGFENLLPDEAALQMFNVDSKMSSLHTWITHLLSTPRDTRRDELFET